MHRSHKNTGVLFLGFLILLPLLSPSVTSAASQDRKTAVAPPSESASSDTADSWPNAYTLSRPIQSTPRPGPAWKTIGGTIKHIKGDAYTVEDYEGNQVQLYISRETKLLRGHKKVGDRVRAEITRDGFANSIQ